MESLQLEVVTPDHLVVDTIVDYVSIPGVEGEFGVLPEHVPFLTALNIGGMHYSVAGKTEYVFVSGGFVEISRNKVTVLADSAELVAEIDSERAERAMERAKKRIEEVSQHSDIDEHRAEIALRKAIVRLNLKGL